MPPIPSLPVPLRDGHVELRDAAERDIPEILIAYQDDPELDRRLAEPRPPSGAELGRLIDTETAARTAGIRATLTIVESGDDLCRGQLRVGEIDWDHRRAGLTVWLAPEARGRGLAGAALGLGARWLLEHTGLLRLQLLVDPDNAPMLGAARTAGFTPEGVLRGYYRRPGRRSQRRDAAVLSLLPSDLQSA